MISIPCIEKYLEYPKLAFKWFLGRLVRYPILLEFSADLTSRPHKLAYTKIKRHGFGLIDMHVAGASLSVCFTLKIHPQHHTHTRHPCMDLKHLFTGQSYSEVQACLHPF